jgi:hypothetical protein
LSRSAWQDEATKKFTSFLLGSKTNTPDFVLSPSPPPAYHFDPKKMNSVLIENI